MSGADTPTRASRTPVYGLDVVRFLAAVLVVVYHLGFKPWAIDDSSLYRALGHHGDAPIGETVTWSGWIGVQVFFVVSGAVIAYSAQGVSAYDFARRRVARLLPALLIAVAMALPIAMLVLGTPPGQAVWLAAKTVVFAPWGPWIIGQFWTIPIELCFYGLIWTLLALRAPVTAMPGLTWALGLSSAAYWLAATSGLISAGGRLTELLLLQHGIYFALGMLCARLGKGSLSLRHVVLAALCLIAAAFQIRTAAQWEMVLRPDLGERWLQAYATWLVLTALVAAAFAWAEPIAARIGRLRSTVRWAAASTYPLYLVHIHVGGAVLIAAAPLGMVAATLLALVVSLLVALAIAVWLEPPLHAAVQSLLAQVGKRAFKPQPAT